jgi:hypothetical protein
MIQAKGAALRRAMEEAMEHGLAGTGSDPPLQALPAPGVAAASLEGAVAGAGADSSVENEGDGNCAVAGVGAPTRAVAALGAPGSEGAGHAAAAAPAPDAPDGGGAMSLALPADARCVRYGADGIAWRAGVQFLGNGGLLTACSCEWNFCGSPVPKP